MIVVDSDNALGSFKGPVGDVDAAFALAAILLAGADPREIWDRFVASTAQNRSVT